MPAPLPAKTLRRVVPIVLGLSLAGAMPWLTACFVNPTPTNPHEKPEGDPLGDPPDASSDTDASQDAP